MEVPAGPQPAKLIYVVRTGGSIRAIPTACMQACLKVIPCLFQTSSMPCSSPGPPLSLCAEAARTVLQRCFTSPGSIQHSSPCILAWSACHHCSSSTNLPEEPAAARGSLWLPHQLLQGIDVCGCVYCSTAAAAGAAAEEGLRDKHEAAQGMLPLTFHLLALRQQFRLCYRAS